MDAVMVQLKLPQARPNLADAAAALGLDIGELDQGYGLIATDPGHCLYVFRVRGDSADRARAAIEARGLGAPEGIFSDPAATPFG